MTDEQNIEAWLRQPHETDIAYQSFLVYLKDLEPPRTLDKAAEALGKSSQNIKALSSKYGWIKRAQVYDQFMQQKIEENTAVGVAEELVSLQQQIIASSLNDGSRLRAVWERTLNEIENVLENETEAIDLRRVSLAVNTLASSRKLIDDMLRKSAKMPSGYRADIVEDEDDDSEYIIQKDGPPIAVLKEGDLER